MTAEQILVAYPNATAKGAALLLKTSERTARQMLAEARAWLETPMQARLKCGDNRTRIAARECGCIAYRVADGTKRRFNDGSPRMSPLIVARKNEYGETRNAADSQQMQHDQDPMCKAVFG